MQIATVLDAKSVAHLNSKKNNMNAAGKTVDTTYLSIAQAANRGFLHRDYIAHCFRWSHVIKKLMQSGRYKSARILDIGCGRELPFAKTLYSSKMIPELYIGIDAGKMNDEDIEAVGKGKMGPVTYLFPNTLWDSTFPDRAPIMKDKLITDIICFEVAEHVEPEMLKDMLQAMRAVLDPKIGRVWISTPCYDWKSCAANHVNEMTYGAFGAMLSEAGFYIVDQHGTFASMSDYRPHMSPAYQEVFNDLREYYDSNVLSTIFAPMFPAYSRNCLWELRIPKKDEGPNWFPIQEMPEPWGSSSKWREMHNPEWASNWSMEFPK